MKKTSFWIAVFTTIASAVAGAVARHYVETLFASASPQAVVSTSALPDMNQQTAGNGKKAPPLQRQICSSNR
jgi:hypothetical protein